MLNPLIKIIAGTPPAIAITLGGIGMLAGIAGAGWLVVVGVVLQIAWLAL
jgi:hypothetical protein